ncbi:MAG: hypothetical protein FWG64_04845 [Firmicutes bacterium]|nr:hypothetical protein [Bacillota bacterium]
MSITRNKAREQAEIAEFWGFLDEVQSEVYQKVAESMTEVENAMLAALGKFAPTGERIRQSKLQSLHKQIDRWREKDYFGSQALASQAQYLRRRGNFSTTTAFELFLFGKTAEILQGLSRQISPLYEKIYRQKVAYYAEDEEFSESVAAPNWQETVLPNGLTMSAMLYNLAHDRVNRIQQLISRSAVENDPPAGRAGDESATFSVDETALQHELQIFQNKLLKPNKAGDNWHGLLDFFLTACVGYAAIMAMRGRYNQRQMQNYQQQSGQNQRQNQNQPQILPARPAGGPPQMPVANQPNLPSLPSSQQSPQTGQTGQVEQEEEYLFIAKVDERTTDSCFGLNGKIFKVSEAILGVNVPPIFDPPHPCRSIVVFNHGSRRNQVDFASELNASGRSLYNPGTPYESIRHDLNERATRPAGSGNIRDYVDSLVERGIMGSGSDVVMNRREGNTGAFAHLPIPMQLRYVKRVARKYDIDISGLRFRIDRDPDKLKDTFPWTGGADYFRIGSINIYPKAFTSEEELARTIFHEIVHVHQYREHGATHVQNNSGFYELEAERIENERFGWRE